MQLTIADSISNAAILDGKLMVDDTGITSPVERWRIMDSITNAWIDMNKYLLVEVGGTPDHPLTIMDTRTNIWMTADGKMCVKRPPPSAGAMRKIWYWFQNMFVDEKCLVIDDVLPYLVLFFEKTNVTGLNFVSEVDCAILQENGATILTENNLCYLARE